MLDGAKPYIQTNEYWPLITTVLVSARTGLGHGPAEAGRVLRELSGGSSRPGTGENSATEALRGAVAFALLAGNDPQAATDALSSVPATSPFVAAARISTFLSTEQPRPAFDLARQLAALPAHTLRTQAHTMTVGAVAALLCGDDVAASAWLSQAAVTWENYGPRHHVALLSARDRRLLWEFARERNTRLVLNYLDIPSTSVTIAGPAAVTLSPRENIVLTALVTHRSARDIAEELVVSPHTVKSQLQSLYRKLGVSSRRSALAVAFELGFIDAQRTD